MTIAELLVQTTATLFASPPTEVWGGYCHEEAAAEARNIVAAIYGEPCGDMRVRQTRTRGFAALDMGTFLDTAIVPSEAGHPGDECAYCKWPRSCHGAKP